MESGIDDLYDHLDAMNVGRVMADLYKMVDIEPPSFFPRIPIEKVVDGNGLDLAYSILRHMKLPSKGCISNSQREQMDMKLGD